MEEPSQKSQAVVSGLLHYLKETNQTELLGSVRDRLDEVAGKSRKADKIVVTSAVPISLGQNKRLRGFVKKTLGLSLPLTNRIDKTILGGLTIKVGDWFVEATIRGQLSELSQILRS